MKERFERGGQTTCTVHPDVTGSGGSSSRDHDGQNYRNVDAIAKDPQQQQTGEERGETRDGQRDDAQASTSQVHPRGIRGNLPNATVGVELKGEA